MADRIFLNTQPLLPIQQDSGGTPRKTRQQAASFREVLAAAQNEVTFSRHAQSRLEERGIRLGEGELKKLDTAVDALAQKGARESLVYLGGAALVVSVPHRTVITAMDGTEQEKIITNIDSAAIL